MEVIFSVCWGDKQIQEIDKQSILNSKCCEGKEELEMLKGRFYLKLGSYSGNDF